MTEKEFINSTYISEEKFKYYVIFLEESLMKSKIVVAGIVVCIPLCMGNTEKVENVLGNKIQSGYESILSDSNSLNGSGIQPLNGVVIEHDCDAVICLEENVDTLSEIIVRETPYINEINLQVLNSTNSVFNPTHYFRDYGYSLSPLGVSFGEQLNALMPMALSVSETGDYIDTRFSWTSAVYTKGLANEGVNVLDLDISDIGTEYYTTMGLGKYLESEWNDADSIGPLQIRSSYIPEGGIEMPCGYIVTDLMSWQDNIQYVLHTQASCFCRENNWNSDYVIRDVYEEMLLMAVLHNSGCEFLVVDSCDSQIEYGWKSAKSVFNYCRDLANNDFMTVAKDYVENWYANIDINSEFSFPGMIGDDELLSLLSKAGIAYQNYSDCFGVKQIYPVRTLLNYLALEKLYGLSC